MLRIRDDQMKALQQARQARLVEALVSHLLECFPKRAARLGAEALQTFVEESVATATDFGVTANASIQRFCDLQFVLGKNFYSSARYPWAARILNDESISDANAKIDAMAGIVADL